MEEKEKEEKENFIIGIIFIIGVIVLFISLLITAISAGCMKHKIDELTKRNEFEYFREGLCVYVEYENAYTGEVPVPVTLWVIDYETEKVIEVDVYEELVHTRIYVGDIILYTISYDYIDADFINVVREVD